MNTRKKILSAFLVASSLALAVPLVAQAGPGMGGCGGPMTMHKGGGMGGDGGGGMMRMLRGLDLSDAQRDQIFELKHAQMPAMREQMKVVRGLRDQLRDAALAQTYDAAKVKALTEQQAEAMAGMMQMRLAHQHAVYQLLTPEQREALKQRRDARGDKRQGMGPGMMRGGPDADV